MKGADDDGATPPVRATPKEAAAFACAVALEYDELTDSTSSMAETDVGVRRVTPPAALLTLMGEGATSVKVPPAKPRECRGVGATGR